MNGLEGDEAMGPREPTPEQCSSRSEWVDEEGFRLKAFWWPQMGGYVARALMKAEPLDEDHEPGGCVTVWVWHDGTFPFTEAERQADGSAASPAELHLCDIEQWLGVWKELVEFQSAEEAKL